MARLIKVFGVVGLINLVLCGLFIWLAWENLTKNMIINLASYWLIVTVLISVVVYDKKEEK
jgi:hypothetical protein